MNVFKVLAARKRFPEEMSSALIGWFLHPNSEHGLGRAFLSRFVNALEMTGSDLAQQLKILSDNEILCNLEEDVGTSQIDIILFLGDFVLAIENKIHDEAIAFGQLQKEYDGLLQKFPDKTVVLVYLVPYIGGCADTEYNSFVKYVKPPHSSILLTWAVTISGIIHDILHESSANKSLVPQRTSVILQMLHEFIIDRFRGYDFMHRIKKSGEYLRLSYAELKNKDYGFVGVENGMSGLLKLSKEAIQSRLFPFDTVKVNIFWISLNEFLVTVKRKFSENTNFQSTQHQISRGSSSPGYMGKFNAASIYEMVCTQKNARFYIGIKGGERALLDMERHEIDNMSHKQVTTGEQPNSQWISGERFRQIYENKFPERKLP